MGLWKNQEITAFHWCSWTKTRSTVDRGNGLFNTFRWCSERCVFIAKLPWSYWWRTQEDISHAMRDLASQECWAVWIAVNRCGWSDLRHRMSITKVKKRCCSNSGIDCGSEALEVAWFWCPRFSQWNKCSRGFLASSKKLSRKVPSAVGVYHCECDTQQVILARWSHVPDVACLSTYVLGTANCKVIATSEPTEGCEKGCGAFFWCPIEQIEHHKSAGEFLVSWNHDPRDAECDNTFQYDGEGTGWLPGTGRRGSGFPPRERHESDVG